jgi:hypothetical protein
MDFILQGFAGTFNLANFAIDNFNIHYSIPFRLVYLVQHIAAINPTHY